MGRAGRGYQTQLCRCEPSLSISTRPQKLMVRAYFWFRSIDCLLCAQRSHFLCAWYQDSSISPITAASISVVGKLATKVALSTLASVSANQMLWLKCGGIHACVQVFNCFLSDFVLCFAVTYLFLFHKLVRPSICLPGAIIPIMKNPLQVLDYEIGGRRN